ncbi:HEPN domain-containing protein [Halarsenatibacter silvermanii]|uniref:HEPN domain-containing protein n=1 Tax=Halarsenatibacter silvermanii TaxID=321763 RepID=A0A1G9KU33_9FIRM|nr:HEPN domain-containing protein [Halarsenatibacter silvermanii]SDL53094.1 HEPN domain-containing protein [Halarsenatibacter silvermanii]
MTEKRKKLIQQWFEKAENDLKAAKTILDNSPGLTDMTAFHCQQAVEKYFKCYLIKLDINFGKSHNLVYLLDLIGEDEDISGEIYKIAAKLNDYAVEVRYPREIGEIPTKEEAKEAYQLALKAKDYVADKIDID